MDDPRFVPGPDSPAWLAAMGEADKYVERHLEYRHFLDGKRIRQAPGGFANYRDIELSKHLFDWQDPVVRWALRIGCPALWLDCGLGKTLMQLEWARVVHMLTKRNVLVLTPLAVAGQTKREGEKFGIEVTVCKSSADVRRGINVANYERLEKFDAREVRGFGL